VRKELNFIEEARNCARLRKNFEGYPGVHIPKIYEGMITEKVLVMEMIEGVRIDNIAAIDKWGWIKKDSPVTHSTSISNRYSKTAFSMQTRIPVISYTVRRDPRIYRFRIVRKGIG